MLSIPDMALLGAAALMFFGPEQLPKVARKAGMLMRDVQNTSQSFIREMERAGDDHSYNPDISRAHLIEDPAGATNPIPPYDPYSENNYAEHPYAAAADPAPVAPQVPASPHHDVMPVRTPSASAKDHDLPP